MHDKLVQIIEKKREDVFSDKQQLPLETLRRLALETPLKSTFADRINAAPTMAVIAEIKLASPTHPALGSPSEVLTRAAAYEKAGADAISFITERHYFKGDLTSIPKLKRQTSLPILQKDFVIDEYQIYQARQAGSDALLCIARLVSQEDLQKFVKLAVQLGLEPVVEINSEADLDKALAATPRFIAVNARDLQSFQIDVDAACRLMRKIPDTFIKLGFSGIISSQEIRQYREAGARGVLVGTKLMQTGDIAGFLRELKT